MSFITRSNIHVIMLRLINKTKPYITGLLKRRSWGIFKVAHVQSVQSIDIPVGLHLHLLQSIWNVAFGMQIISPSFSKRTTEMKNIYIVHVFDIFWNRRPFGNIRIFISIERFTIVRRSYCVLLHKWTLTLTYTIICTNMRQYIMREHKLYSIYQQQRCTRR